jgi:CelD/BcsL family acetyltransferase involved in cellulose biosynthesis
MPEAIETLERVEPVADEWDELAIASGAPPFVRPGWVSAWWEAFGSGQLSIVLLRRDGRLAGVLPVLRHHGGVFSPTNWHTPAFGVVAEDEAAKLTLVRSLFESRPRRVQLAFLAAEAHEVEILQEAAGSYRVVSRLLMQSPYVAVDQDWDTYWSGLSKNLRGTIRRCRNRLADRGEIAVAVDDGSERLGGLLEEGFAIEATGWKGEEETAINSRPETRRFYEQVARWAAAGGFLRLAFLRVDGRPVAFSLNFETNGRHYLLKQGHDAELSRLGPGTVLTSEMMSRTFSLGLESYEFLGSTDSYKLRWTKSCRDLLKAQAFARSPTGATDRVIQTHGRTIAKKILRRA